MTDFQYIGFEELEGHGFIDEYVVIDHSTTPPTIKPSVTVEHLLSSGFKPKGTKLRFLNANGYDGQRKEAEKIFDQQKEYTIKTCSVGRSSSSYTFEEVDGEWNTVMFGTGETIVQFLQRMADSYGKWTDMKAAKQKLLNELKEYEGIPNYQLTRHTGTYSGSGMLDNVVCSCGWDAGGFFDGAEYAYEDWRKHVKRHILTKPEWPIEEKTNGK